MNNELTSWLQPGKAVRVFYGEGNHNNRKLHVRAIVDDEFVVVRWWSRHKRRWVYEIEWVYWFKTLYKSGCLLKGK